MRFCAAVLAVFLFQTPYAFGAPAPTEFGVVDDLTVLGSDGTVPDPDLEVKGFTVFGSTNLVTHISTAPGNVIVNGSLEVSNNIYSVGTSTFAGGLYVMGFSSATKYYGDGSSLTGLTGLADNLGNHIATQDLKLAGFNIVNAAAVTASSYTAVGAGFGGAQLALAGNVIISSEAQPALGAGVNVSTNMYIVGFASATKFYGDGSGLTGLAGTLLGGQVPKLPYWTAGNALGNSSLAQDAGGAMTVMASTFTVQGAGGIFASRHLFAPNVEISSETSALLGAGVNVSTNMYIVGFASATKFYGDGSSLTGLSGLADNLGNHTAAQDLKLAGYNIVGAASVTASSYTASGIGFSGAQLALAGNVIISSEAQPAMGAGVRVSTNMYIVGFASATKFYGDGSGLTGLTGLSDNLGNHTATQDLKLAGYNIVGAASVTASSYTASGIGFSGAQLALSNNVVVSSETQAALGAGVRVSTNMYIVGFSSAAKYYGDGSALTGISGNDNLGDHVATQNLNMAGLDIGNVNFLTASSAAFTNGVTASSFTATGAGFRGAQHYLAPNVVISSEASAALGGGLNISSNVYVVGFASATRFYGDGSSLTGLSALADNLGNHTAAQDLKLAGYNIVGAASVTASSYTASGIGFSGAQLALANNVVVSSETQTALGAGVRVSTNMYVVGFASATKYYGDGSSLTGLSGLSDNLGNHTAAQDLNMTDHQVLNVSSLAVNGNVGIGIASPLERLEVGGYIRSTQLVSGGAKCVYADANGRLGIKADDCGLAGAGGDDLGNHIATKQLNMSGFPIINVSSIAVPQLALAAGVQISSEAQAALGGGVRVSTNMYIVGFASATKYYGDGSGLTGVAGTLAGGQVPRLPVWTSGNTLGNSSVSQDLGGLTVMGSSFTVQGDALVQGNAYHNGRIGIGTASPWEQIEISKAGGPAGLRIHQPGNAEYKIGMPAGDSVLKLVNADGAPDGSYTNNGIIIDKNGRVGLSTGVPQGRLDVLAAGSTPADMAQIWRRGDGVIVGSMSATGSLQAARFIGDGSGLTGVSGSDNLGDHTATKMLAANYGIAASTITASTVTLTGYINVTSTAGYAMNGDTILRSLGTGTFVGREAGVVTTGVQNTFIGYQAGNANTTGRWNSANGYQALYSNTIGDGNAAIGESALYSNTTGDQNTASGGSALYSNTDGDFNTANGSYALYYNDIGRWNTASGYQALFNNTAGEGNTANGALSMIYNTTGGNNTVSGTYALYYNTVGSANAVYGVDAGGRGSGSANSFSSSTIMGYRAGYNISTGGDNTLLGWQAGYNITSGAGNIIIGYDQRAPAANTNNFLNIGGVIYGDLASRTIGISTRSPQAALDIVSTGTASNIYAQIWRNGSGVVVASMTSQGVLFAALPPGAGDNLGNHTATQDLGLGGYNIVNASSITVAANVPGLTVSTNLYVMNGSFGVGTSAPSAQLHVSKEFPAATDSVLQKLDFGSQANRKISFGVTSGALTYIQPAQAVDETQYRDLALAPKGGNVVVGNGSANYRFVVSSGAGETGTLLAVSTGGVSVIRMTGSGEVYANKFYGDGSGLSGMSGALAGGQAPRLPVWTSGNTLGNSAISQDAGGLTVVGATFTVQGGAFSVGGSSLVVANNNVGVGTDNPLAPLHVKGGALTDAYFTTGDFNTVTHTGSVLEITHAGRTGNTYSELRALSSGYDAWNNLVLQAGGGNVGISSTTPMYHLVVSSGAGESGIVMAVSTGSTNVFWVAGDGAHATRFYGDGSALTGIAGDNLGSHTAAQNLNMASFNIVNVSSLNYMSNVYLTTASAANGGGFYVSSNVYVVGFSSASRYYGDGSALTGIAGDNLGTHTATRDLNLATFNVSDANFVTASSASFSNGVTASSFTALSAAGIGAAQVKFAPAIWVSSAAPVQYGGVFVSTHLYTSANIYAGNVTAAKFYGDGSGLTNLSARNYLTVPVPAAINDYAEIGNFDISNGGHNLFVAVTVSDAGFIVAKQYILPISYNMTSGLWRDAVPVSNTGAYSGGNDFALEVRVNNTTAYLRIRRTGGAVAGTALVSMEQVGSTADTFTPTGGAGTSANNAYLAVTALTQTAGNVGIGTIAPGSKLEVAGDATLSGSMRVLSLGTAQGIRDSGAQDLTLFTSAVAPGPVVLTPGAVESARFTPDLKLGIGTASPSYRLQVSSAAGFAGTMMAVSTGTSDVIRLTGSGEVYANKFIGDGSGLTGIGGSDNLGNHTAAQNLNMAGYNIVNVSTVAVLQDLLAPRVLLSSAAGFGGDMLVISTGASFGVIRLTGAGEVYATKFIGDGSGLTGMGGALAGGQAPRLPVWTSGNTLGNSSLSQDAGGLTVMGSTLTVQGNAFSVGGSTLSVINGNVGVGVQAPAYKLEVQDTGAMAFQVRPQPGYVSLMVNGVEVARMKP